MHRFRIYTLFAVIVLISMVVGGRLFFIQIVEADRYQSRAESQYVKRNYHLYERGEIFFKSKDGELVSAATVISGYLLAINPEAMITDPSEVLSKLKEVIDIDEERFMNQYERGGTYREVASRMNGEEALQIRLLGLRGVDPYPEHWRYYPGGKTASHIIGFTNFDEHEYGGRYGLERQYESVLKRSGSDYKVNFFAQIFGNIARGFSGEEADEGEGDVVTTIEPMVQAFLERELEGIKKDWDSSSIGGIVIDPETGAVKAMASNPSFDSNKFSEVAAESVFANPLVERVYEMGSVVKPLTIAAGIDSGVIDRNSEYYDSGTVSLDGYVISNFDGKGNGYVTMQDVLNRSINTGVVHIMQEMGTETFAGYMRNFGLDSKTDIELPNESENLLRNFDSPRLIEYATASFGQGVAVTPIGMTRALSALANGGKIVDPYMVEGIRGGSGEMVGLRDENRTVRRVISEESSREISRMLVNTVDEALLNGSVALTNHTIAAKTGTAQMAYADQRGYREDGFLHSFFGYFPAYDPEFLIFLFHIEPKGAQYASQTLTEPFMDIVTFLIQYYDVNPDR